ncbi:MAG: redoxin family protein, partial [Prevotellaceae bacterium]|nr:redoxin family protein [Prevotellaceae bacterium]
TSCKKDEPKINVVFPDIQYEVDQHIQKYKYMAVVYIDSAACTYCSFSALTMWKHLTKNLAENDTGVLFIIRHSDEQLVINSLKTHQLTIPFIFDKGGAFKKNNKNFYLTKGNVFVMDKNKTIIMAESPIANGKAWERFVKIIRIENKKNYAQKEMESEL